MAALIQVISRHLVADVLAHSLLNCLDQLLVTALAALDLVVIFNGIDIRFLVSGRNGLFDLAGLLYLHHRDFPHFSILVGAGVHDKSQQGGDQSPDYNIVLH